MRILITGANGFVGSAIARGLQERGHEVLAAVRSPSSTQPGLAQAQVVALDLEHPPSPDALASLLTGVDALVNAAGIIREGNGSSFAGTQRDGPKALFAACERAGVKRVLQISALGADADAETQFHLSKRAADDALAKSDLDWLVLRPSIVVGPGGRSMELFAALAALPLVPLIGDGAQRLQPVDIDDLVRVATTFIEQGTGAGQRLDLVGAEPLSMHEMLVALRRWLGMSKPRFIHLPRAALERLATPLASLGGLLTPDNLSMLQRGNTADPRPVQTLFEFTPKSVLSALAARPAGAGERLQAGLWPLTPLLRLSIAATWLGAGLVSALIYPIEQSLALLAPLGLSGYWAFIALYAASALDLLLGPATLSNRWLRPALWGQLALMAAYTLLISLYLPEQWAHPYGPVLKNLPLAVATLMLLVLTRRPGASWTT